jgi:diguanylate cyclase (GGDEF)-like protein
MLVRVAASLAAVVFALNYYRRVRRQRVGRAWRLILFAVVSIPLAEAADILAFGGNLPHTSANLFRLFTEITLAVGLLRLYVVELAEGRAREESLKERAQQAESLSSATLELAASLKLNEVLQGLLQQVLELTSADAAAVYYDADDAIKPKVLAVRRGEDSPQVYQHYPAGLIRQIVMTGQPEIIQDLAKHPLGNSLPGLKSAAIYPMLREHKVKAALFAGFRRKHSLNQNDQHLLSVFAEHASLAMHNAELYETVERLSVTDALTGLANRRRSDQELKDELARARRYDKPLALILFDLDHFKTINDRYGHPAGDCVLTTLADILRRSSRQTDIAVRLGGEEFALILPETDAPGAVCVAERVRKQLAGTSIPWDGLTLSSTVSAGVIGSVGKLLPTDPATLLRLADEALYHAKEQGRNQVVTGQLSMEGIRESLNNTDQTNDLERTMGSSRSERGKVSNEVIERETRDPVGQYQ